MRANDSNSDKVPESFVADFGALGTIDSDERCCRRILEAVGLRWRGSDLARLERWLEPRLRALRLPSIAAYAGLVLSDGPEGRQECEHLMRHFSTGETYFFRDRGLFERLEATILPELLMQRTTERSLRIWSAGCASGEEAYSLAMLIDEMAPRLAGWDVSIVGSDINGDAVERARTGIYGRWSFRGLDPARSERYFRQCPRGRQVIERLRTRVRFERADLLRDAPPEGGAFDLVLCRNVFIYLSEPAVARIVERLSLALTDGGYLIAGHGELVGCATPGLAARTFPEVVAYRKGDPVRAHRVARAEPHPARATDTPPTDGLRKRRLTVPRLPAPRQTVRPADVGDCAASSGPPCDVDTALTSAWRDADRGAADAAQAACQRLIAAAPLDPRPYYLLAQLALERGAIDEARALLRKVLYLAPSFVMAQLDLADLCDGIGEADTARRIRGQALRELERLAPDTVLAPTSDTTAGAVLRALRAADGAGHEWQAGRHD